MTTVEEIFGKPESEVTEEEIRWYFDNCVGYPKCEVLGACALPFLPKGWELYLWKKYSIEDVVKRYEFDCYYAMMMYEEAAEVGDDEDCRCYFNSMKKYFLESWKSKMVLTWVNEGRFDRAKSHDLKKMYMDLAMIELKR